MKYIPKYHSRARRNFGVVLVIYSAFRGDTKLILYDILSKLVYTQDCQVLSGRFGDRAQHPFLMLQWSSAGELELAAARRSHAHTRVYPGTT